MEPIDADFIEQTAFFMFNLTKNQLDERIADLKNRQFGIYNLITISNSDYKNQEKKDYAFRMALVIIRIMESYDVKLPMISIKTIKELMAADIKSSERIDKSIPEDERLDFSLSKIGQPHYIAYLKEMVSNDEKYHEIFTIEESHNNYFCVTAIAMIYVKTIERYSIL